MPGSIAAIRSPSIPMSTGGRSSQTRAFVISRSIRLPSSLLLGCPAAAWREHGGRSAACHWQFVPDDGPLSWQDVTMTPAGTGRTVRRHARSLPRPARLVLRLGGAHADRGGARGAARRARREPGHGDRVEQGRARGRRPARATTARAAGANDLVVAIDAADDAADEALAAAEEALSSPLRTAAGGRRRAAPPAHAGRGRGREPRASSRPRAATPRPRRSRRSGSGSTPSSSATTCRSPRRSSSSARRTRAA